MSVKPIPEGYHSITPYLIVEHASKLIEFLRQAFNAKEISKATYPNGDIMHAEVKIGDSIIMLSEAKEEMQPKPATIYLYVNDIDKVYQQAMKAGAISTMEPKNQYYGDRSAGLKDEFGNEWWIASRIEDVTEEEIKEREEAYFNGQNKNKQ